MNPVGGFCPRRFLKPVSEIDMNTEVLIAHTIGMLSILVLTLMFIYCDSFSDGNVGCAEDDKEPKGD